MAIEANSGLVFGANLPLRRTAIESALLAMGIKVRVTKRTSRSWAIETAVRRTAAAIKLREGETIDVRRLSSPHSFEAVRVRKHITRNSASFLFSAQVVGDVVIPLETDKSCDPNTSLKVTEHYNEMLGYLSTSQSRGLVERVIRKLGGTPLGGVNTFYMPPGSAEQFTKWALMAGADSYRCVMFNISTDPDTVSHVADQLVCEVGAITGDIFARVAKGDISGRSARALEKTAAEMVEKISRYETCLGLHLTYLKAHIEEAKNAMAVSSLLAASV
jgi:hypothetical protein